ncbi:MAG: glycosyltransferase [Chlamydiales bacterium]
MNKVLILSHTEFSRQFHPGGVGEIVNTAKLSRLMKEMGYPVDPTLDIYTVYGEPNDQSYRNLATLNLDLAELGYPLLELGHYEGAQKIFQRVEQLHPDLIFILSWNNALATFFATGIQKLSPIVSKLYIFEESEEVFVSLYAPSDLLVTECLLANQKGIEAGLPPWKMIYLPHHFPQEIKQIKADRNYLEGVAKANNKPLLRSNKTVVIGMVSRLAYRKNCSYVFEAVSKLVQKGYDLILVIKGNYDGAQPVLEKEIARYQKEPWFLWDKSYTPFPKALAEYQTFDLFVHLSGREGGSNTVVEMLALGIATVVLDGTTNPFLFKGGALFCPSDEKLRPPQFPFQAPDRQALLELLEALVESEELRKEWQKKGQTVAYQRFHPDLTRERLPLIFDAAFSYRKKERHMIKAIEALYASDCERYAMASKREIDAHRFSNRG